jgi:hypothetical protein
METGKKQIEKFTQDYAEITTRMMNFEIPFYDAVKNLMQLCWQLLLELVKEWQINIREAQEEIEYCPECRSKLYTNRITNPELIFPFGKVLFFNRKVKCSHCKYHESLLNWWITKGVANRISPLLGEKIIWLSALLPYREVAFYLKEFWGLEISVSGIQRYVNALGKKIVSKTDMISGKMELQKEKYEKVYIYADGVMVYINNRWREVKVGIIECYKNGKSHYFYYSGMEHWESFLKHMKKLSEKLGCDNAGVKIFISDAGKGITSNVHKIFDDYKFLIDYYHASEHIAVFLKSLGENNKELLTKWRATLTSLLYKGKIEELVSYMDSLCRTKKNKILQRELAYFRKHEPYFDYALFRQHKWWIGSGKIESACRWLIQQRFKLSGMRWKIKGFQTILDLRLALFNNRLFPAYREITMGVAA